MTQKLARRTFGLLGLGALSVRRPAFAAAAPPPDNGKLNIIIFGAHPDDAEYRGAGVAMKWARAGHRVKFGLGDQRRHRSLADRGRAAGRAPA